MIGTMEMSLVDRQNLRIAKLAGKLGRTEVLLDQEKQEIERLKKVAEKCGRAHADDIKMFRDAIGDALEPIERALIALKQQGIEVHGLNSAFADLQSL